MRLHFVKDALAAGAEEESEQADGSHSIDWPLWFSLDLPPRPDMRDLKENR